MAISKIGSKGITDLALTADDLADGTISNDKLAGSIANDKLANSSVTLNGTSVALGGSADIGTQWQSVITADGSTTTTAVAGEGYFIDTSSAAHTINLPASPSIGDTVIISQLNGTNSITIGRNSSNINGSAADTSLSSDGDSLTLVYSNASEGWKTINSVIGGTFIQATGGTVSTSGDYKIHTFTSTGCFTISTVGNGDISPVGGPSKVDYLVVAGGGGGGVHRAAGGGAGGFRESKDSTISSPHTASPLAATTGITVTAQTYPITVGAGGAAKPGAPQSPVIGNTGSNSVFSTITSAGGGGGGGGCTPGGNGGSGGGGGGNSNSKGLGNTPPVSPSQGNNGGDGATGAPNYGGGGGGGATAVGANGNISGGDVGGDGGAGATTSISGTSSSYAGGGGGSGYNTGLPDMGVGGIGGGGNGAGPSTDATAGGTNTGGGGGGGFHPSPSPTSPEGGAAGGSGIVIIRYKYQ